jgi:predicted SAM-dependent methyltransferase
MKLNLGCGLKRLEGYINIDSRREVNPDIISRVQDLEFGKETISEIYACHILEHLTITDAGNLLLKCFNWLRPNGELYISVPDLQGVSRFILEGEESYILYNFLYGDMQEGMNHRWGYTEKSLKEMLKKWGFDFKCVFTPIFNDDSAFRFKDMFLSLNMIFKKE